jgi:hypothetical protein
VAGIWDVLAENCRPRRNLFINPNSPNPVVQPTQRPAPSLMKKLAAMCIAFVGGNALFIIYHTHASAGRGPGGNRPRPEQPHVSPNSTIGNELVNVTGISGTLRVILCVERFPKHIMCRFHKRLAQGRMGVHTASDLVRGQLPGASQYQLG